MSVRGLLEIKVLYEQLHVLRAQVEGIAPEAADKPGKPGSGMSVLVPRFNALLARAKASLHDDLILRAAIADIEPIREIKESLAASYHTRAKHGVLIGCNLLLQALAPRILGATGTVALDREGIFVAGEHFDAVLLASRIIARARQTISLIDGYINYKVLDLLKGKHEDAVVQILTKVRTVPGDITTLTSAFNQQYGQKGALSIRGSEAFHDRFLIIDDSDFYHFGASLKDLGGRGFMFSRIEEPAVIDTLRKRLLSEWQKGDLIV